MADFGCADRSQTACDIWRVLVSRFDRTNAFGNKVIANVVVKLAGEFVPVLGTRKKFQHSCATRLQDERRDKRRLVRIHACMHCIPSEATSRMGLPHASLSELRYSPSRYCARRSLGGTNLPPACLRESEYRVPGPFDKVTQAGAWRYKSKFEKMHSRYE